MNKLFLSLLFMCTQISYAQIFTVSNDKNNVLFAGVENPLTIVVQNIDPANIIVKTNNGKITTENAKGKYVYYTDTGSTANIVVFKKTKNGEDVIGLYPFKIKQVPDADALVSGRSGGKIAIAMIRNATNITAGIDPFHFFEKGIPITRFALCIIRDNKYVYLDVNNTSEQFNQEIKDALLHVEPGDSVIFKDIFATRHDQTTTILNTVSFIATN